MLTQKVETTHGWLFSLFLFHHSIEHPHQDALYAWQSPDVLLCQQVQCSCLWLRCRHWTGPQWPPPANAALISAKRNIAREGCLPGGSGGHAGLQGPGVQYAVCLQQRGSDWSTTEHQSRHLVFGDVPPSIIDWSRRPLLSTRGELLAFRQMQYLEPLIIRGSHVIEVR